MNKEGKDYSADGLWRAEMSKYIFLQRRRKAEKEKEEIIWRRKMLP